MSKALHVKKRITKQGKGDKDKVSYKIVGITFSQLFFLDTKKIWLAQELVYLN